MSKWARAIVMGTALVCGCSNARAPQRAPSVPVDPGAAALEDPLARYVSVRERWLLFDSLPDPRLWQVSRNGDVWFELEADLVRLSGGGRSERFDLPGVRFVTRLGEGPDGELLLVGALEGSSARSVQTWSPRRTAISELEVGKPPLDAAWSQATRELWYVADDGSLNVRSSDGGEKELERLTVSTSDAWWDDEELEKFEEVFGSGDGREMGASLLVGDGLVVFSVDDRERLWSCPLPEVEYVAFGPGESVVGNVGGFTTDDDPPRVFRDQAKVVSRSGQEAALLPPGYQVVAASGTRIVVVMPYPDGAHAVVLGELKQTGAGR